MATEETLNGVLSTLFHAYPRAVLREDTLKVYADFLRDIPDDALKSAVAEQIKSNEYFPAIAQICRAAAIIQTGVGAMVSAMDAWGEVCEYMRRSVQLQPKFSNPFIDQIVKDMNWYNLRMSENPAADRSRFIEAYDAKVARALRDCIVPVGVRELTARNASELSQRLLDAGAK